MPLRPAYELADLRPLVGWGTKERPLWSLGIDPDTHDCAIALLRTEDRGRTVTCEGLHVVKVPHAIKGRRAAALMCYEVLKHFKGLSAIQEANAGLVSTVEAQVIILGKTRQPEDILMIAEVKGAAEAAVQAWVRRMPSHAMYFAFGRTAPIPKQWKGTLAKHEDQPRTWKKLGYTQTVQHGTGRDQWVVPMGVDLRWSNKDYKQLGDAAGQALYGIREVMKQR